MATLHERDSMQKFLAREWKKGGIPKRWDGKAGERIVGELARLLAGG